MKLTNKERNNYISQIKKLLFCSSKDRKKFLKEFNDNIDDFLKDNPEASVDELQKAMGTPQEIADGFLGNTSTQDIKKRTSIVRVLIIFATIITLIITAVYVSAWIDAHRANYGGHYETTIIYGTEYVEATTSSP